ncbi:MAG: sigma-70 family RNA polymerase sigma factor [Acidobacteria bacterium]|nr:sigma-70 family RNA polymerase sigma factor [Acidobacteriota bacterium]
MSDRAHDEDLLERWRAGELSRSELYSAVEGRMRHGARQGLWVTTSKTPNEDDVGEVLFNAFEELETKGPHGVDRSLIGFARKIAYRRGQDLGRKLNRQWERQIYEVDWEREDFEVSPEEEAAEAERDALGQLAIECMEVLTDDQADVINATLVGDQTLSDWVVARGVTHQAASRTRQRALRALERCIDRKRDEAEE